MDQPHSTHINLYELIKIRVDELINDSSLWLRPEICRQLTDACTYYLDKFRYDDLLGVALTIGIDICEPTDGHRISVAIIGHYHRCFELLRMAWKGIRHVHGMVTETLCERNDMVTPADLNKFFNHYQERTWMTVSQINDGDIWSRVVTEYNRNIDKLLRMMNAVYTDINNRLTDKRLTKLELSMDKTLCRFDKVGEIIQLIKS